MRKGIYVLLLVCENKSGRFSVHAREVELFVRASMCVRSFVCVCVIVCEVELEQLKINWSCVQ